MNWGGEVLPTHVALPFFLTSWEDDPTASGALTAFDADSSSMIPRLQCQLLWSWEKIQLLRAACFATAAVVLDCFGVSVQQRL